MLEWLASFTDMALFWKAVVMGVVVIVVSFTSGWREAGGEPPLWPPQPKPAAEPPKPDAQPELNALRSQDYSDAAWWPVPQPNPRGPTGPGTSPTASRYSPRPRRPSGPRHLAGEANAPSDTAAER